jgi:hypothetical protein
MPPGDRGNDLWRELPQDSLAHSVCPAR